MAEPRVLSRREEPLVSAMEKDRNCRREPDQSHQQELPGELESNVPENERCQDKQIRKQSIARDPQLARYAFKNLPLRLNFLAIETRAHDAVNQSISLLGFGISQFVQFPGKRLGHFL